MGRFKRGERNRSGERFRRRDSDKSGESFGRRDFGRPGRNSEIEMHNAICDKCGKECQVPFKPTGGKPVYCSDCFRKHGNSEPRGSYNNSPGDLEQINMKLDKILKALNID